MNTRQYPAQDRLPLVREACAREKEGQLSAPQPLSHYRDVQAWVLLADPGAGKSDVFASLSDSEAGTSISARDFVEMGLPDDWQEPLFIDGLDEVTAGSASGTTPLGSIRQKLQRLGTPKFRISCREADWRGNADAAALGRLVGDGNFAELHLTALSHTQSVALVAHWQVCTEDQAKTFMREAGHHDLDGLLNNPQTLRLLAKAHSANDNKWPDGKTATYAMACSQLVREPNEEHLANSRDRTPPDDQTLLAAGYLCAVMLLSASGSIALQRQSEPRSGVLSLPDLKNTDSAPDLPTCRFALHTRLFRGDGTGAFWPVHRTVAEYLGAYYLSSLIQAGLPVNRVLALMLGQDGGLVPELRGLHAWLAAVAPPDLRRELITHDPLGVVLNGDVRAFSRIEKLAVLAALQHEATQDASFRRQNWASHPFGALATPDMEGDFRALLQSPERGPAHQAVIGCILDALKRGQPMPMLAPVLEQLVRDSRYWAGLRLSALNILVSQVKAHNNWATLHQLLSDIHDDIVEDSDDRLLSSLLTALYPGHLSPTELWLHFRKPKTQWSSALYSGFWRNLGKKTAPAADIPALLDGLLASGFQLKHISEHRDASECIGDLLVRGLNLFADGSDPKRLYAWLSLGLGEHHFNYLQTSHSTAIRDWLSAHPRIYKALFAYGLAQLSEETAEDLCQIWRIRTQLCEAPEPDDAAPWYLSLAKITQGDNLRHELLGKAFETAKQQSGADAAIFMLEQWSQAHSEDTDWINRVLSSPYPPSDQQQKFRTSDIERQEWLEKEHAQQVGFFKQALPSFETGPAHLGALAAIGNAYLNYFGESNEDSPRARLFELLNQNHEWVSMALEGLRKCLYRADVPSSTDVIDLDLKGSLYNLALPCLAAMDLRYTEDPLTTLDLAPSILETVTAFFMTSHTNDDPVWFKQLLTEKPEIVCSVMLRLIGKQIAAKKEHADGVFALACDPEYALVARLITPALITAFPAKASKKQLHNLRMLLVSAWVNVDKDTQLSLIANKLDAQGLDVAQQTYGLVIGAMLAPELYLTRLQEFVKKSQIRTQHIFALLYELRERGRLQTNLPTPTQLFLVELLGPNSHPAEAKGPGFVTTDMETSRYVAELISSLAGNPDKATTQALVDFQQRQDMKQWHDAFKRALYDQRITRRKALFQPATVKQVCNTLANLQPASAADLWALTVDHLTRLIRQIRDSDKDIYDLYWDGGTPKSEERCRNALMSALEPHLSKLEISAIPERQLADKKRADIGIAYGLIHIPLEAKGEWNRDLWKAIDKQLIAQYCRDPACDGYGIYLVFWFSGKLKSGAGDRGRPPKTPQELQQRLTATLPEALKHKIAVLVVDCSKPSSTKPR